MKQLAAILFATGFTYLVSLLAGKCLLRSLRTKLSRLEENFLGFVLGAAMLSGVVFGLTAAGWAHRGNFLAAGLLIIAIGVRRGAHRSSTADGPTILSPAGYLRFVAHALQRAGFALMRTLFLRTATLRSHECERSTQECVRHKSSSTLSQNWKIVFALVYGVFAFLYFMNALLPEFSADGTGYHVAYAARYLREHHFPHISSFIASYPEGVEMLFLFAYAFGRHTAAAMVHWLFLMVTPFGILAAGRRMGSPLAGAAGGLLFFLSPIAGRAGTSAYVDVALAAAIVAVFLLLEIWRQEQQTGLLVAIGLCAGFAFAVKYPGGLVIPYALGAVIFYLWKSHKPFLRPAILVAACSLVLATPWMVKNWIMVRNPVAPFANQIFPNPYFSAWAEKTISHTLDVHRGVTLAELPREATVGGSRVAGVMGPIFLLAPLLLLGLGQPAGRRIAVAALVFAIPYYLDSDTRFAIPCLAFVSLGMALAVARWPAVALSIVFVHAVASWPAILNRYVHPYTWRIDGIDWKPALRLMPEADFLRRQLPDYDAGLLIEKTVPAGEPVFSFSGLQQAYHSHEVINEWTSSFGTRISDTLRTPFTLELQPTRRHDYVFSPMSVQKIRLVQTAASPTDRWSITEFRVFRNGVEIPRTPQWRLAASSNPWDVGLAFDNSPVTRWASDESYRPGMFVELDFGGPVTIDRVSAECTRDQGQMHMRLDYEQSRGRWQTIVENAAIRDIPPPDRMRGAAIQEVKRNNLHWLLVHDLARDRGADDFNRYQQLWGIRLAGVSGRYELYRLE